MSVSYTHLAVRRAVLGSKDMELIRLYSDVPEFRQRLHREVTVSYTHLDRDLAGSGLSADAGRDQSDDCLFPAAGSAGAGTG